MKVRDLFLRADFALKNQIMIGRAKELYLLKRSILEKKDRIVAISGRNATGKTTLWQAFLSEYGGELRKKTDIIKLPYFYEDFPSIESDIDLVIVEDLSMDHTLGQEDRLSSFIKSYPLKQFILVGAFNDFLDKFKPQEHIHLELLPADESVQLFLSTVSSKVSEKELVKIIKLTQGNPYLIKLVAQYLNKNVYNFNEISKLITENFKYQSIFDKEKTSESEKSYEFVKVSTDIRLVNKSILEKMNYNADGMHNLTPRQFEEMVAELMIKRGYDVSLTKQTRDGGKDLIIANHVDIGNFMYYIECKKYAPTNPVGVNLVRELAGTIFTDRVTAGIMITSSYFSPDAIRFSEQNKHQISLIDFIKLKEWIKNVDNHRKIT